MHALACTQGPRDAGNKNAASAYGMGSGGLAVDAMAIGCRGVDHRGERFFVLSHHDFRVFHPAAGKVIRVSDAFKLPPPVCVCVFITAGPMIKLCAGGRGTVKDMCYEVRRAEACVD